MKISMLKPADPSAGSWVIQDSAEALAELGHRIDVIDLEEISTEGVICKITDFKPDFILSVDHVGLTPLLLKTIKVPCISWFIDNPSHLYLDLVEDLEKKFLQYSLVLSLDRIYIEPLRRFGFENVEYLPMATNPRIFKFIDLKDEDFKKYRCNLSFVGTSGHKTFEQYGTYLEEKAKDPKVKVIIEEAFRLQAENPLLDISTILEVVQAAKGVYLSFNDPEDLRLVELIVEYGAMAVYRGNVLRSVADLGLDIYGDEGMKELLGEDGNYCGGIDYKVREDSLPKVYNATKININITRAQSKTSLPMRVFDILACRAFLLTDYRRDLGELFSLGEEVVCYRDLDELRRLAEYYLEHEEERMEIAKRGEERILKEHTYKTRMETLIEIVEEKF